MQRMKDLFKPIRAEGKLDDYLLYLDFWNNRQDLPVVLLKDRSVMVLFELAGVDYEGLSEEEKSLFAHYLRSGLEQLPDEGLGFRVQNYLVRDRAQLVPLVNHAEAPEVIRFVQDKKMEFWREVGARSYQNRVVCGLRYYTPKKLKPSLRQLWTEEKRHDLERGVIDERVEKLLAGVEALKSGLGRFGFRVIDRSETQPEAGQPGRSGGMQPAPPKYRQRPGRLRLPA